MSNLSIKKHASDPPTAESPLRVMRRLLGWDPFQQMTPFIPSEEPALSFAPAFEVKETKDGYEFRGDIPGVKEDDVEVTITGNRLSIAGSREQEVEETTGRYFASERLYGSFVRTFTLPEGVDPDGVSASLESGVLHVTLPKKAESQPKKISLKHHHEEKPQAASSTQAESPSGTQAPQTTESHDESVTQQK